jgi:hypothetical protein
MTRHTNTNHVRLGCDAGLSAELLEYEGAVVHESILLHRPRVLIPADHLTHQSSLAMHNKCEREREEREAIHVLEFDDVAHFPEVGLIQGILVANSDVLALVQRRQTSVSKLRV